MKKILIADRFSPEALSKLRAHNFEVTQTADPFALASCPPDIDGLIIRSRLKVNKSFLQTADRLQVVITATSGFDHIDFTATAEKKVKVMYTPEGNSQSAAEQTWALLLACVRKTPLAHRAIHSQNWDRQHLVGHELQGKTLGIVGLGRVGRRVARFALAFDMNVQSYDPYAEPMEGVRPCGLMELLRSSDIITLHVPLTPETHHLINYQTVEHIHQAPILINASRGQIVCEADLAKALKDDVISAAGLDVFEKEPLPNDSPLIGMKNVVLSPHVGANTVEAFAKVSMSAAEKMIAFFNNGEISDELPPKEDWYHGKFK